MSKELVPVHGGLAAPVDRFVPSGEEGAFRKAAQTLPKIVVKDADRSTACRIADGVLSPLVGFMGEGLYTRALEEMVIESKGRKYAWGIPLSLPVTEEEKRSVAPGKTAALVLETGELLGTIEVDSVFPWDKKRYNEKVYGTAREDHPGARIANDDSRTTLLGGALQVLRLAGNPAIEKYVHSPVETRRRIAERKWEAAVAFQTRNPLHRAHEYALVYAMEKLTREGKFTGVVLNPLVGETKGDDVDAATRMHTYERLRDMRLLGQGDKDEALWKEKGYDLNDQFELWALDIKMFYGGPREAVMHAIYRQNFGFSNIVIGRKHADAPYDDGTAIWGDFDAQEIFDKLPGELHIKPVKVGFAAYYESMGRVDLMDNHPDEKPLFISGKQVRGDLTSGRKPDPRVLRPEISELLIEKMAGR
ncbi:MAG: sulfate adenylyltransferase [Myxococcota bacterium]|jgi:sulfate adenylyltransferase|nr:sulfate adenylyltransferase [Myxococcota bacterium]